MQKDVIMLVPIVMMTTHIDIKRLANYAKVSDHNGVGFAIRDYLNWR